MNMNQNRGVDEWGPLGLRGGMSCIVIKNARNTALDENKSKEVKVRRLESLGKVS